MEYTVNCSFIVRPGTEGALLEWLEGETSALRHMRISAMRMAAGVEHTRAEAQTVALQAGFDTMEKASAWSEGPLRGLCGRFEERFGPEAMAFVSVFEVMAER